LKLDTKLRALKAIKTVKSTSQALEHTETWNRSCRCVVRPLITISHTITFFPVGLLPHIIRGMT